MKTGECRCGNRIYFNNFCCVACGATLGQCGECHELTSFTVNGNVSRCDACHAKGYPCNNRAHCVCNSFVANAGLCQWCLFTKDIPDLNKPDTVQRWARMEAAKRRLLLQLHDLMLPPFVDGLLETHPLSFRFIEDTVDRGGNTRQTITGHAAGIITINLAEADSVHRERARVTFGEPHRTLIGHMRHEVGHYIDWAWASGVNRDEYHRLFGNPESIDYAVAMQRYYDYGPPANWADRHVSAYATMHPWEDFAETVNAYLDIMAIATTANDQGRGDIDLSPTANAETLVAAVLRIVVEVSEYNFDLGLQPLLPEKLPPPVMQKLAFLHRLRG